MRFRFCGDLDCPDWILAEISILSKISSVKLKLFCQQVVTELLGNQINYEKIEKFTADAKFTQSDKKAAVAAVDFIFLHSSKYGVPSETLSNELQQLGLPKELSASLCRVYNDNYEKLREALKQKSLRLSKFKSVDWRVDYLLSSSVKEEVQAPEIQLKITKSLADGKDESVSFTASYKKFRILLTELKAAQKHVEDISK